jgi:serine phosphatase RsbU (regulator of sigma subunit)
MKNGENTVVLVIDDDTVIRQSIASYLSNDGCRVILAGNSKEGIASFHSSCPDLVICDINLPKSSDGFDTLKTIFEENTTQPIIILSEEGGTEDVIRAMRLGVSDYLIKPLDLEILAISIENSLKRATMLEQNIRYRKNLEEINRELEERLEIFQMDQQAGRHVQLSMLPKPPQTINNFHFNHCVIPSLYLSGDSVDYQPITKRTVLFYIGDVSGHGSSSAFITVLLRFRIAQMRREYIRGRFATDLSPAHILHELNKDLLDTGLDKHITVCIGMLDNSNNYLEYSVAGHHPLPILYEKGKAAFIDPGKSSFPIGLVEDAEYFNTRLELAEDFTLFLLSDGILEHLEGGSMADKEDKLLDVITKHQGDFIQVKKALNLNMGIKVPDDIAMLSVTGT